MSVRVDLDSGDLYFRISEDEIEESEEVSPGVILDFARRRAAFRVSRKEDFKGEIRESRCVME